VLLLDAPHGPHLTRIGIARHGAAVIIPPPPLLQHPPLAHLLGLLDPALDTPLLRVRRVRPRRADLLPQLVDREVLDGALLGGVPRHVGEAVHAAGLAHGHDEPPRRGGRGDGQQRAAGVQDRDGPLRAAVLGGEEGADEGLAFVLVQQVARGGGVGGREGGGREQEVEQGREDGGAGAVLVQLQAREERVVEHEGHADVAHVAVFEGAVLGGVFFECHAAGVRISGLGG
jgi:hypothetical protein